MLGRRKCLQLGAGRGFWYPNLEDACGQRLITENAPYTTFPRHLLSIQQTPRPPTSGWTLSLTAFHFTTHFRHGLAASQEDTELESERGSI